MRSILFSCAFVSVTMLAAGQPTVPPPPGPGGAGVVLPVLPPAQPPPSPYSLAHIAETIMHAIDYHCNEQEFKDAMKLQTEAGILKKYAPSSFPENPLLEGLFDLVLRRISREFHTCVDIGLFAASSEIDRCAAEGDITSIGEYLKIQYIYPSTRNQVV